MSMPSERRRREKVRIQKVRVFDLEKTALDCLSRPTPCGGVNRAREILAAGACRWDWGNARSRLAPVLRGSRGSGLGTRATAWSCHSPRSLGRGWPLHSRRLPPLPVARSRRPLPQRMEGYRLGVHCGADWIDRRNRPYALHGCQPRLATRSSPNATWATSQAMAMIWPIVCLLWLVLIHHPEAKLVEQSRTRSERPG